MEAALKIQFHLVIFHSQMKVEVAGYKALQIYRSVSVHLAQCEKTGVEVVLKVNMVLQMQYYLSFVHDV